MNKKDKHILRKLFTMMKKEFFWDLDVEMYMIKYLSRDIGTYIEKRITNYVTVKELDEIKIKKVNVEGGWETYDEYVPESPDGYRSSGYATVTRYIVKIKIIYELIYKDIKREVEILVSELIINDDEVDKVKKEIENGTYDITDYKERIGKMEKRLLELDYKVLINKDKAIIFNTYHERGETVYKLYNDMIKYYANILAPYVKIAEQREEEYYLKKRKYDDKIGTRKRMLFGKSRLLKDIENILEKYTGRTAIEKVFERIKSEEMAKKYANELEEKTTVKAFRYSLDPKDVYYINPNNELYPKHINKKLAILKAQMLKEMYKEINKERKKLKANRDLLYSIIYELTKIKFTKWNDLMEALKIWRELKEKKIFIAEHNRKRKGEFITRINGKIFFIQNNRHIINKPCFFTGFVKFEKSNYGVIIPTKAIDEECLKALLYIDKTKLFDPETYKRLVKREEGI